MSFKVFQRDCNIPNNMMAKGIEKVTLQALNSQKGYNFNPIRIHFYKNEPAYDVDIRLETVRELGVPAE